MFILIDYSVSRLGSAQNMLKKLGAECTMVHDIAKIENGSKLILPGVGVFDSYMAQLNASCLSLSLDTTLNDYEVLVANINLIMQHFADGSEEGQLTCLGRVITHTVRFMQVTCRHWRRLQLAIRQAGLSRPLRTHARCRREKLKAEVE